MKWKYGKYLYKDIRKYVQKFIKKILIEKGYFISANELSI